MSRRGRQNTRIKETVKEHVEKPIKIIQEPIKEFKIIQEQIKQVEEIEMIEPIELIEPIKLIKEPVEKIKKPIIHRKTKTK